ncbi:hypothetical protein [Acidocella sp. C78]|uniref:hypothetical protein n=1 Tax=Acidocella sp. C78 TaxID=1671486 RepID=UPI001BD2F47A|nr:hypothetical protein [Acidocella sp. C78]
MSALADKTPSPDRPGSRSETRSLPPEDRLLWPQLFPYRRHRGRDAGLPTRPALPQERESEDTAA